MGGRGVGGREEAGVLHYVFRTWCGVATHYAIALSEHRWSVPSNDVLHSLMQQLRVLQALSMYTGQGPVPQQTVSIQLPFPP